MWFVVCTSRPLNNHPKVPSRIDDDVDDRASGRAQLLRRGLHLLVQSRRHQRPHAPRKDPVRLLHPPIDAPTDSGTGQQDEIGSRAARMPLTLTLSRKTSVSMLTKAIMTMPFWLKLLARDLAKMRQQRETLRRVEVVVMQVSSSSGSSY